MAGSKGNMVTIIIKSAKGEWETTFQKSTQVKNVILAVKVRDRLPKDGKYELTMDGEPDVVFEPERALVNYGIKDGNTLVFRQLH